MPAPCWQGWVGVSQAVWWWEHGEGRCGVSLHSEGTRGRVRHHHLGLENRES